MSWGGAHSQQESPADVPGWLRPLVVATRDLDPQELARFSPPDESGRRSAVLILFGDGDDGPDVLSSSARDMRSHAGQPAFPGGAEGPRGPRAGGSSLREAQEETGLEPSGVDVLHCLPDVWLPPSGFVVTPVLGWWRKPTPVSAMDPAEVSDVHRSPSPNSPIPATG